MDKKQIILEALAHFLVGSLFCAFLFWFTVSLAGCTTDCDPMPIYCEYPDAAVVEETTINEGLTC